jgi:hypothetical protein
MKKITLVFIALLSLVIACKKDGNSTPSTPVELMTGNGWKVDRFATLDGTTITSNKLNATTALILTLDFAFLSPDSKGVGVVRATDKISKQVVNAGTWAFIENNTKVDIKVVGFTGAFSVVELSKTKLVLRNKVPVSGVETDTNMEFSPVL